MQTASRDGEDQSIPWLCKWMAMRHRFDHRILCEGISRCKGISRRFERGRVPSIHRALEPRRLPLFLLALLCAAVLSACSTSPSSTSPSSTAGAPEEPTRGAAEIPLQPEATDDALRGADSLFARIEALYASGRYPEMMAAAEQAARRYEAGGNPILHARTLHLMGDAARLLGDVDGASAYLRKADQLANRHLLDDPRAWQIVEAATERRTAAVRWSEGRLNEALALLESALQRIRASPDPAPAERAAIYTALGAVQKDRGEYSQAVVAYEQALDTYATAPTPSPLPVAVAYNNAGDLYAELGDTDRALRHYRQALTIYDAEPGAGHPIVGTLYNNIAIAHSHRGEYEASLAASARALQLFRATLGEAHPKVGWVLGMRASSLLRVDRTTEAMEAYRTCVEIYRAAFGNEHPYTAAGLVGLAWGLMHQGQHENALQVVEEALTIRRTLHGDRHPELARVYHVTSDIYARQGRYDAALTALDDALQANRLPGLGDLNLLPTPPPSAVPALSSALSSALPSAGTTGASDAERDQRAEDAPAQIETIVRGETFASDIMLLGTLWRRGNLLRARAEAESARQRKDAVDPADAAMNDRHQALAMYRLGLDVVDRMRRSYRNEASKLELTAQTRQLVEGAVQVAFRMYQATRAAEQLDALFRLSERARANVLRDAIAESNARQFAGVPDTLLRQERRLRESLATHEQRLREEHLRTEGPRSDSLQELNEQGFRLRRAYDRLLHRFEREHPAYYALKHQVETTSLSTLQNDVLSPDEALVTYVTATDTLFLLTATREEADATAIPIDTSFTHRVRSFRASIVERDYDQFTALGHALYQTLIEPATHRRTEPRWIVVPDGVLHTIPFEPLLTAPPPSARTAPRDYRSLPYLVRERSISYAYSATLLHQQRRPTFAGDHLRPVQQASGIRTPASSGPSAPRDFIAFAPVFSDGIPSSQIPPELNAPAASLADGSPRDTFDLGRGALPATRSEVRSIARRFQSTYSWWDRLRGDRTQVYTDRTAREARFREEAGRYRFIHLATHGFAHEDDPSLSRLLLSPGNGPSSRDDGVLHLSEIYTLELNAEMVVLSACETGIGRLATGEGVIGLARGFVYAGAQNVVVSLWQAADAPTRDLMVQFYDELLSGTPRADALRQAKLNALDGDAAGADPYVWAPFVMIGR